MYIVDREYFFDNFPFRPLKHIGVETVNQIIDNYNNDEGYQYLKEVAYVLATAYHESAGTWNPSIREYGRGIGKKYGLPDKETGEIYYGRGLCQLTWKSNYEKFSKILGIDLVQNPDLALDANYSILILMVGMRDGIFTNHRLSTYFNDITTNWIGARKIINGKDRANLIASYGIKFHNALKYLNDKSDNDILKSIENPDQESLKIEASIPHPVEIDGQKYEIRING